MSMSADTLDLDVDDSLPPSKHEEEAEEEKVAELASQRAQMLRQRNKAEFGEDGALVIHSLNNKFIILFIA